jgi:hypothetical protein
MEALGVTERRRAIGSARMLLRRALTAKKGLNLPH